MDYYIVNHKGYYFRVHQEITASLLRGCCFFETKEKMYKYIMSQLGLGFDEVDCCEMVIRGNYCIDPRGVSARIDGSVESFIVDFAL